jgi:hypothetical protein
MFFVKLMLVVSTFASIAVNAAVLPRTSIGLAKDFSLYKQAVDISPRKVAEIFVTQLQDLGTNTYKIAVYPRAVTIKSVNEKRSTSGGRRKQEDWATGTAEYGFGTAPAGVFEQLITNFEEEIKKSIRNGSPTVEPHKWKECELGPPHPICPDETIVTGTIDW